jgi:NhaP-type Na+/H+ or K+/H+ antiporter
MQGYWWQASIFDQAVLHGMLAFLLFAGALQLDLTQLGRERVSVLSLSVFATVLSTVIVGVLFKVVLHVVGISIGHNAGAALWCADLSYRSHYGVGDATARRCATSPQDSARRGIVV